MIEHSRLKMGRRGKNDCRAILITICTEYRFKNLISQRICPVSCYRVNCAGKKSNGEIRKHLISIELEKSSNRNETPTSESNLNKIGCRSDRGE